MMKIDLAGYRKADRPPAEEPAIVDVPVFEEIPPEPEPPDESDTGLSFTDEAPPDVEDLSSEKTELFSTFEPVDEREESESEPPQEDFSLLRSAPAAAETIALSLRDMDFEPAVEPHAAELPTTVIVPPAEPEEPLSKPAEETVPEESAQSGASKVRIAVFAVLLVAAAGFLVWSQWGFVSGLVGLKPKPAAVSHPAVTPAPSQKAPAPAAKGDSSAVKTDSTTTAAAAKTAPAPAAKGDSSAVKTDSTTTAAAAKTAPAPAATPVAARPSVPAGKAVHTTASAETSDAALSALGALNRATPPRVWLTSVTVTSEGAYELKGMSFSHEAMTSFARALSSEGTVALSNLPARVASPEHVYSFSVAGKLGGMASPGVLDTIPPDRLAALGDSLKTQSRTLGVAFVRLPRANAKYEESDLPFEASGTYEAVISMIRGLTASGKIAVHRISVNPAVTGGSFDRIRAGFSLRSVSAL